MQQGVPVGTHAVRHPPNGTRHAAHPQKRKQKHERAASQAQHEKHTADQRRCAKSEQQLLLHKAPNRQWGVTAEAGTAHHTPKKT